MNIERRTSGTIELRLSDDPDQFTSLAEAIREKLAGHWTQQADGLDQSYWDLDVQGKKITVHREHYLGVVVFCDDDALGRSLLERLHHDLEPGC
jgi:hypothetical protein